MKAVQITETGDFDKMKVVKIEIPTPSENEVLVQTKFCSVNMIDTYERKGIYKRDMPHILGRDGSGIITKIGSKVKDFKIGDKVCYFHTKCYSEYCTVPTTKCIKIPDGISFEIAVGSCINGLTAHYLTRSTVNVKKGSLVLVHACSGATGQWISQICKLLGATVIGTCSESKMNIAKEDNVDYIINYRKDDFGELVKSYCKERNIKGVDCVFDGVGKMTYMKSMSVLKPRGLCIFFGNASGTVPPIDPLVLTKMGSIFITRPSLIHHIEKEELQERGRDLFKWVAEKKIKFRVHKKFKFEDIAKAHKEIEDGKTTGKILLQF